MKKKFSHTVLTIVAFTSFVVFTLGCTQVTSTSEQKTLPTVEIMQVESSSNSAIIVSGRVFPEQEVNLVSKIPGKVALVNVKEGDAVSKDQELVQLEANDYVLQVKQAESGIIAFQAKLDDVQAGARSQEILALEGALQQATATVEQTNVAINQAKEAHAMAKKSFDRTKSLFDHSAVSQADLDKADLELKKARLDYEQTQSQLKAMNGQLTVAQAKLDLAKSGPTSNTVKALQAEISQLQAGLGLAQNGLEHTSLKSPTEGIVVKRNIEPGEMAQPGIPLLTLVKMDQVLIQVSISQNEINQVVKGEPVEVRVDGFNKEVLQGTIDFVSPVSDPDNNTFPVKVRMDNSRGLLRAGMLAKVYFNSNPENHIVIPSSALIHKDDKTFVYTYDHGVVHLVEIKTEGENKDQVIVKSGLQSQDKIVINPSDILKDDSQVRVH